jgi:hypothetical protein
VTMPSNRKPRLTGNALKWAADDQERSRDSVDADMGHGIG